MSVYFTAGPAKIPQEVMDKVRDEFTDYKGMGIGVVEMSHRSSEFNDIITECEANLRKLANISDDYTILFMHGGAKTQFDSVPMNLCPELDKYSADYIVNGSWSKMAANDAKKYLEPQVQAIDKFNRQPEKSELKNSEQAVYRYYCDNETIEGVEFNYVPESGANTPLVCDMTSNFLSRPIDVNKFGIIFAGAQKNCGVAGLAIVIVRNDLIGKQMQITPTIQNYQVMKQNRSLYNTPLTFNIYVANLCFLWMLKQGGLEVMDKKTREKSDLLYETIDNSAGFYTNPVKRESRSRVNVVFLLAKKDLESEFLKQSQAAKLFDLKGHRTVGGFRASLYHGITIDDVRRLVKFMNTFREQHS